MRHQGLLSLAQLSTAAAAATAAAATAAAARAAAAATAATATVADLAAAARLSAGVRWKRVPAKRHAQCCSAPHAAWAAPLPRRVPRLAARAGGAAGAVAKPAGAALPRLRLVPGRVRNPLPRAHLDRATRRCRRARSSLRCGRLAAQVPRPATPACAPRRCMTPTAPAHHRRVPSLVGLVPGGAPRANTAPADTPVEAVMRRKLPLPQGGRGQALGLFRPHQKSGPGPAGWLDLVALTPQMGGR